MLKSPINPTALIVKSAIQAGGVDGKAKRTSWVSGLTAFKAGTEVGRGKSNHAIALCHIDGQERPAIPGYIIQFLHVTFLDKAVAPELVAQVRVMRPLKTTQFGVRVVQFPASGVADHRDVGHTSYVPARDLGAQCGLSPIPGSDDTRAVIVNLGA
jgi:hypothetical protein